MNNRTVFTPAEIALPDLAINDKNRWTKWAVIACDQFTSDPGYWANARTIREGDPSALDLVLPEVYLGTDKEEEHKAHIAASMKHAQLHSAPECMMWIERTLPDGRVRQGLLGKIDLEKYDYSVGSTSAVRATEATVLERIPPRMAIRAEAVYELPHVLLLIDDKTGLLKRVAAKKKEFAPAYDFDLMLGGGHIAGFRISGDVLAEVTAWIEEYEASVEGDLVYAVGDGNHSLASAKAFYEKLKAELGDAAMDHPARYALVELTALQSRALDFEPIYRVVTDCDTADFLTELGKITGEKKRCAHTVRVITESEDKEISFLKKSHALTVGTLQNFIDAYTKTHPGVKCDYIHDEEALIDLAKRPNSVGFLFGGMKKNELFPYVQKYGTLPRKTFSMGEARSKRYYIEARKITR
ncbi:MAG: DUF1015 domain-containing protein [Lachnospiraceae bacterium]|nr:DUF1015 domain-containing protein [Lachnospiraceae bacterium]